MNCSQWSWWKPKKASTTYYTLYMTISSCSLIMGTKLSVNKYVFLNRWSRVRCCRGNGRTEEGTAWAWWSISCCDNALTKELLFVRISSEDILPLRSNNKTIFFWNLVSRITDHDHFHILSPFIILCMNTDNIFVVNFNIL